MESGRYDVRVIDTQEWGGDIPPTGDVRLWQVLERGGKVLPKVHGILAAPPCPCFNGAGAHTWKAKDADGRTLEAISIVDACVRLVWVLKPTWWALENPKGRLYQWLGRPAMAFDPCDFGDPYTKRTLLWGNFTPPTRKPVPPTEGSKVLKMGESKGRARARSVTPSGFAQSFYEANP